MTTLDGSEGAGAHTVCHAVAAPRSLLVLSLALLLGACSVLPGGSSAPGDEPAAGDAAEARWPEPAPEPEPEPLLPEPGGRNVFFLEYPSQSVIGEMQMIRARHDDTFSDIAREYGLGYDEMVAANPGVDPWLPGEGTRVLLPTQYILPDAPREGIVLNVASKRIFYYAPVAEGQMPMVLTYPVGIGRVGWNTPEGVTRVVAKVPNPAWNVPASIRAEHARDGHPLPAVVPPGPDNPLGQYMLRLGMTSYLIHGTNKPYGVGMRVSHGCVRLYPENIEILFAMASLGETVRIINQPYMVGWSAGDLYLEAHRPLEEDVPRALDMLGAALDAESQRSGFFVAEWQRDRSVPVAEAATGYPVRVLLGQPDEVMTRVRLVRNTVEHPPEEEEVATATLVEEESSL